MAESSRGKTQRYLAAVEDYMEDRYYIHPPRHFMMKHFLKLWGAILFLALCSIGLLPFFFVPALLLIFYWYRPLLKLWCVYYSKLVLIIITLLVFVGSYLIAPLIRSVLWSLLQSIV